MMHTAELLKVFAAHRGDAIVVPGRGGRHWVKLTNRETLDVPLGDPSMGGHAGFALGLALAQPDRKVVLFDSEGDILMSLGMLATIAEQAPENFYHFLLDNECYATTGGQPVPNAKNVTYETMARGAGYPRAFAFKAPSARERNRRPARSPTPDRHTSPSRGRRSPMRRQGRASRTAPTRHARSPAAATVSRSAPGS
jgi:hypothetical protein